ncbi:MAG: hypothetical protein R3A44_30725 [Caldilineaceae bacterium]
MLTTVAGICALRKLRKAWQEDAGDSYPEAVMTELLVLYDVCSGLELNIFQKTDILGQIAWEGIQHHLDTPVMLAGDIHTAERVA